MDFENLIAKYIDGSISDSELAGLRSALKSDPKALKAFLAESRLAGAVSESVEPPKRFDVVKALADSMKNSLSDDELLQFQAARGGHFFRKPRKMK